MRTDAVGWVLAGAAVLWAASSVHAQSTDPWSVPEARGEPREISFTTDEGTWMSVDVSPDDSWIVFDLLAPIPGTPAPGGDAVALTQNSGIAVNYHPRISPDGTRIAFVSDRSGQDNLWVMNADGSDPHAIDGDLGYRVIEPRWSPDGRHLFATQQLPTEVGFYRTRDVISVWPVTGGPPTPVIQLGVSGASTPSRAGVWSGSDRAQWASPTADGRYIYFHSSLFSGEFRHIRRFDRVSGTIHDVTGPKGRYIHCCGRPAYPLRLGEVAPEISPDGRSLAFVRKLPGGVTEFRGHQLMGRSALWLRDLATGHERILMDPVTNAAIDQHPSWNVGVQPGYAWAGDGRSIVVAQGGKIRRVDVATGTVSTIPFSAPVRRTISEMAKGVVRVDDDTFEPRFVRWPTTSPDGSRIVFEAAGWLWSKQGGNAPQRLTSGTAWGRAGGTPSSGVPHPADQPLELMPAWAPGGESVAFVTWDDLDAGHVWTSSARGEPPTRWTSTSGRYAHPAWSPDGATLLVNRWDPALEFSPATRGWQLVALSKDGTERVLDPDGPLRRMTFDPEGRVRYSASGDGGVTVYSFASDGTDLRPEVQTSPIARAAALSPDGRTLAVDYMKDVYVIPVSVARTGSGLHMVEPAGPGSLRLTRRGGTHPRWRSDGKLDVAAPGLLVTYDPARGTSDSVNLAVRIPRSGGQGTIALTGARIIPMVGDTVIESGTVVVEGSRISCVGDCEASGADRVVDVTGATITPGWVDVHAHHLGLSAAEHISKRRSESARYLVYGVTTTHDPSSVPEPSFSIGEYTAAGRIIGPRTFSAGQAVTCGGPSWSDLRSIETLDDARDHVYRLADQGALSIKDYKQCTRIQRQMLAQAARERGVTLTSENGNLFYILGLVMGGHTGWEHPLQYVPTYSDVTRFLGQAGAFYSADLILSDYPHGNALEYWLGREDLWANDTELTWSPWQEVAARRSFVKRPEREFMFPILAEAAADVVRAGGRVPVGAHGELDGYGAHWEVWTLAQAMTPFEALRSATLHGAEFLGLEQEIGSLEVGKLADLVVFDVNPLDDIGRTTEIRWVMVGGNLFERNTLNQVWPLERSYGPRPWTNDEITRRDVRGDDYWNRRQ